VYLEPLSLTRQLEMVFRELKDELASLASGTIFVQIRNNLIGKFGVKHDLKSKGNLLKLDGPGLSDQHLQTLHQIGMLSLQRRRWTHGEIQLEFAMKDNDLDTSIISESNYNMNHLHTDK